MNKEAIYTEWFAMEWKNKQGPEMHL